MRKIYFLSILLLAAVQIHAEGVRVAKLSGKQVLKAEKTNVPVLGYLDNGALAENPAMVSFLDFYAEALRRIDNGADMGDYFVRIDRAAAANDSVGPLLGNIKYDQGDPYNRHCPSLNNEGRSVTGCVATAMAQVMRYYQYPACGTGVGSYSGKNGKKDFDMSQHPFDWKNILEEYTYGFTSAQADAVANLMLACGASVNMSYSADGSGSNTDKAADALRKNFFYPKATNLELYVTDEETRQEVLVGMWGEALRIELDAGRPVIYAGSSGNSITGHCFVVDGYKFDAEGNTYFHINWGWSGVGDGWFLITSFQPNPNETNYSYYRNTMVIQIYPEGWTGVEDVEEQPAGMDLKQPIYNILGQQVSYDALQRGMIYIQKGRKFVW